MTVVLTQRLTKVSRVAPTSPGTPSRGVALYWLVLSIRRDVRFMFNTVTIIEDLSRKDDTEPFNKP